MAMQIQIPARPMTPDRSCTPSPHEESTNLYFGYGSNLWQHQVASRCPKAKYLGVGRLRHWRWQINQHGYANVVEAPHPPYSPMTQRWLGPLMGSDDLREDSDRTYGFVYQLTKEDEEMLDRYEDVPGSYTKEYVHIDFWTKKGDGKKIALLDRPKRVRCMIYVDRDRTTDAKPSGSYIYKMNEGIQDALGEGIPAQYVDTCIRPYVPIVADQQYISIAIEDAVKMGIDVKKMVEETEVRLATTGAKEEGRSTTAVVSQDILDKYLQKTIPEGKRDVQQPNLLKEMQRRRALSLAW